VLDAVREVRPPFSPENVTSDFARLLKSYRIARVTGDHYAGEWPREQFRKCGVSYDLSDRPKSVIYGELLPLLNSGKVELLDHDKLYSQLTSLERRTGRGRDSIDHPPKMHDDVANAVCGALLLAAGKGADEDLRRGVGQGRQAGSGAAELHAFRRRPMVDWFSRITTVLFPPGGSGQ
jgi:hypothetical protein